MHDHNHNHHHHHGHHGASAAAPHGMGATVIAPGGDLSAYPPPGYAPPGYAAPPQQPWAPPMGIPSPQMPPQMPPWLGLPSGPWQTPGPAMQQYAPPGAGWPMAGDPWAFGQAVPPSVPAVPSAPAQTGGWLLFVMGALVGTLFLAPYVIAPRTAMLPGGTP